MKNVFKTFLVTALFAQLAFSEENEDPVATCYETMQVGIFMVNTNKLQFFRPFAADAFVSAISNDGSIEKIPAEITFGSWITYKAKLNYKGRDIKIEFSNYQSPNIGTMSSQIDPQVTYLACELTR
jgi:hypothetical protein